MSLEYITDATMSTDLGVSSTGSIVGTSLGRLLLTAIQEQIEVVVQAALTKALAPARSASPAVPGS